MAREKAKASKKAVKSAGKESLRNDEGLLPSSLHQVLQGLRDSFGMSPSFVTRIFTAGSKDQYRAAIAFIDGMVNRAIIDLHILQSAMLHAENQIRSGIVSPPLLETMASRLISAGECKIEYTWLGVIQAITGGDTVLFVDGVSGGLVVATPGWDRRSVEEPLGESVVRGPRDGFTETLLTNETLVRRRIRNPRLWFERMVLGEVTQTTVSIGYIKGIADEAMVEEVRQRLKRIKVDSILESGYLEEYIQDSPWAIFPQIIRTERPDIVAGNLLEGRIAVFTDNTPFVLVLPITLNQLLSSPEDYYERFPTGTLIRLLRFVSFLISLTLPAIYIAITTYHQELLPTDLILAIASARQGVPFPALVEALIMETVFEILREAGIRLPRVIGQAVSIVGALVIGDAAVSAGLVSPAMVIVVATTAIASFATPHFGVAISARVLRFGFMFSAATLGLFGIQLAGLLLLLHVSSLRSFGVPYLAPFAPLKTGDLKDTAVRLPHWLMINRPRSVPSNDPVRQEKQLRWRPPDEAHDGPPPVREKTPPKEETTS